MSRRNSLHTAVKDYGATTEIANMGCPGFTSAELRNMGESIAEKINVIGRETNKLQRMMKKIGGPKDTMQLRVKIADLQKTVNGLMSVTTRDMNYLSAATRYGDKPKRLHVNKLNQAFEEAVFAYTSIQKQVSRQMAMHVPKPRRSRAGSWAIGLEPSRDHETLLMTQLQAQQASKQMAVHVPKRRRSRAGSRVIGLEPGPDQEMLLMAQHKVQEVSIQMTDLVPRQRRSRAGSRVIALEAGEQEMLLMAQHQAQEYQAQADINYLLKREACFHQIEKDMIDVNQIMQDLSHMVDVQAVSVERVENRVEDTCTNVSVAESNLAKGAESQRSHRKIMMTVIIVGAIAAIIFFGWTFIPQLKLSL